MTLEAALITHRLLPGSWFRRPTHPAKFGYAIGEGSYLEQRPVHKGVLTIAKIRLEYGPAHFSAASMNADDWEVIVCD